MQADENAIRITLRLPGDVHQAIVSEAKSNGRSINTEIVHCLQGGLIHRKTAENLASRVSELETIVNSQSRTIESIVMELGRES